MKANIFIKLAILSIILLNDFALNAQTLSDDFIAALFSPNATADKLIFISSSAGNGEIMRVDSDGTNLMNLTNNTANDFAPAYSPTLNKFVFVSNRTGTNQIFVMNADGSNQTNLSNSPMSDDTNPSWSPDGAKIVFMRDGPIEFSDDGVSTMNADGSNQFRVYYLNNFSGKPAFSPDGTYIIFYDGFNVLSVEPNGANISFVASADSGSQPYLSPDGAKLVFVNFDEFGVRQIFTVSSSGANYTQLTSFATDAILPKWSPDGLKITFAVLFAPNAYRIYTMNADGSNQMEITPNPVSAEIYSFPEWSPDNSRLAFTGNYQIGGQNFTGLGKINSDGTNQSFLAAADTDKPILWIDPTLAPVVRFVVSASTVFENEENAQIKFLRSGNLSAATTVDFTTADGTATAGQDYTAASGMLNFAAGEITKTFNIAVTDDNLLEQNETVLLSISNPTNGTLGAPSSAVLTIVSNDSAIEIAPESLNQTYSEADSGASFTLVRTGDLSQTATVVVTTTNGTATNPDDYDTFSETIEFPPFIDENSFTISLNSDGVPEPNEFFTVTLSSPTVAMLGTNFTTPLNISDDDSTHTIENANYSVRESAGMIAIKVRRNVSTVATSVSYQTVDGTAIQPDDYTQTSGTLNFAVGVSEITVNVPIILNLLPEPNETFQFQLLNPLPGNLGTPNSAVITILDEARTLPVAPDLVAWWTGDGNALDVRNRNHGTLQSGTYADGKVGQGFNFNGSGGGFVVPNAPSLNPTTQISLETWIFPTTDAISDNAMAIIANKEVSGTVQYEIARRLSTGFCPSGDNSIPVGNFAVYIGGLTGLPDHCGGWVNGGANLPLNTWSHVAMTYDGANLRAYVNGNLTLTVAAAGTIITTNGSFRLGSRIIVPEVWAGGIDETAIYSRALSTAEIQKIYNFGNLGKHKPTATVAPSGLVGFWSGDGNANDIAAANNGTLQNGAGFAIGKVGQSFKFDGVDDAILLGNSPALNVTSITLDAWINTNDFPNGTIKDVVSKWGFNGQIDSYLLGLRKSGGVIQVFGAIGNGISGDSGFSGVNIEPNTWTHIAMTYNAADGDNRLFINGTQVASRTRTGGIFASNLNVYIGREDSPQVRQFNGSIDEVSIYNRPLTQAEISSIYYAGLAGKLKTANTIPTIPPAAVSVTVGDATITFPNVSAAGTTQQIPLDANLFSFLTNGTHTGLFYDIATSASFTGNPTICFNLPAFTAAQFANLRVLHFENGNWVNVTASVNTYPTLCTNPVSSFSPFAIATFTPSAANVSVSGRVTNSNGNGIGKIRVSLTNSSGNTRTLQTNGFGYYQFDEVAAGETYVISVNHKRYVFNPNTQILNVSEAMENIDFTASE